VLLSSPIRLILFFYASRLPPNLILQCFISLALLDLCMTLSELAVIVGVLWKCFCSSQFWLCANTYSIIHQDYVTILCYCVIHEPLWYGPWICDKPTNKNSSMENICPTKPWINCRKVSIMYSLQAHSHT